MIKDSVQARMAEICKAVRKSNQLERIQRKLDEISIGCCSVIFGVVVTRWGIDDFEVGTYGKEDCFDVVQAAKMVRRIYKLRCSGRSEK
jgi:hypothetical protein